MTTSTKTPQMFTEGNDTYALWIPSATINDRIQAVGNHIAQTYQGKQLRLTVVLQGGKPFFNALLAAIKDTPDGPADLQTDALRVRSYKGEQSCELEWINEPQLKADSNVHELLIEDIVDSGQTFFEVVRAERTRGFASVGTVALLNRPEARKLTTPFVPDFVAFEISNPQVWAAGFGMDIAERHREKLDIYGKVITDQAMPGYRTPTLCVPQCLLPQTTAA